MKKLTIKFLLILTHCFLWSLILPKIVTGQDNPNSIFECGQAVITCFSGASPSGHVLGIKNIRDKSTAPIGSNWTPPAAASHPDWVGTNMGEVFGLAIDDANNIYATATIVYGNALYSGTDGGKIYKIDASTGAVSTFATLPNVGGVGLGNICYDGSGSDTKFYVTNFEDGKIYMLSSIGNILGAFDPFAVYDGVVGCAPLGEILWGIGTYNGKLYFSRWNSDFTNTGTGLNEIYSVNLSPTGAIIGLPTLEITVPAFPGYTRSSPVSDIAFSSDGKMLLSERGNRHCQSPWAGVHKSRVLEYELVGASWNFAQEFYIGNWSQNRNSSGGVDYGYDDFTTNAPPPIPECDTYVWATGDALRLDTQYIYGIAGIPATGNGPGALLNSIYIDADNDVSTTQNNVEKTQIGDVEIFKCGCTEPCSKNPSTKTFSVIIDSPDPNNAGLQDRGFNGIEESTGDFRIVGDTYAYGTQDVFGNKLDYAGNLDNSMICSANFDSGNESVLWMNEIKVNPCVPVGGGFIYTGHTLNSSDQNLLLKATDKSGSILYAQEFGVGSNVNETGNCVIQDSNGDYVTVGNKSYSSNSNSIYAAGLNANCFFNKWTMEYYIQGNDVAYSVIEIPGLLDPFGAPVYGITGKTRSQVFILLINSTNGQPFVPNAFVYDLDNDPTTSEIAYSLSMDQAGDLLVTGSADRPFNPQIGQRPKTEIFVFKIENPEIFSLNFNLSWVNYYDIPGSDIEWSRHIAADDNNDYILTGVHQISGGPQPPNGLQAGESFLLSLRSNGDVKWINEYIDPDYNGSSGYRVEPVSSGGYYMTGSIWKNAPGPTVPLTSYNDQFAVRTDPDGLLDNCDCCAPIEVEVIPQFTEPIPYFVEYGDQQSPQEWWDYRSERVDALTDHCDQYCPCITDCDSLDVSLTNFSFQDSCCYVVDIENNHCNPIVRLEAEVQTFGWQFNLANLNINASWNGTPTPNKVAIDYNFGNFPTGITNNLFSFCLINNDPAAPPSQSIKFTWYELVGTDTLAICETIHYTECEPKDDPPEPPCAELDNIKITCDSISGLYKMTFDVVNNHPSQTITNLLLHSPMPGTVVFRQPGSGTNQTSVVIPINVMPNSTNGQYCIYLYSTVPINAITNMYFKIGVFNSQYCCHRPDPICVQLPPCDCMVTSNFRFECVPDSNKYRLTFDVTNLSPIAPAATALQILVKNTSSPPIVLSPGSFIDWTSSPLAYGSTKTVNTCVTPFPISDPDLILGYILHHSVNQPFDTCCFDIPCDTIPIPDCDDCCEGTYEDFYNDHVLNGFNYFNFGNCDFGVSPNSLDECHQVTYIWGDGTSTGPLGGLPVSVSHSYPGPGSYYFCIFVQEIDPLTGEVCFEGEICEEIFIEQCGPCEDCLLNQNFTVAKNYPNYTFTSTTTVSSNCQIFHTDWYQETPYVYLGAGPNITTTLASNPPFGIKTVCQVVYYANNAGIECIDTLCKVVEPGIIWHECDPVIDLGDLILPTIVIKAGEVIISSGIVPEGEDVTFEAGQIITLDNNFSTELNSDFSIKIEDCVVYPCWDTNENGDCDPNEDLNGDGICNDSDCP